MTEEAIALFHQVANLAPSLRVAYYSEQKISQSLRDEVESLLPFDTESEPIRNDIEALVREVASAREVLNAGFRTGARCGPYRLIRALGEGGMGTVFLAERADGEVEQRVAIKFVRAGYSQALHDRFIQERSILASLSHPGIAHLLDAGRTEDGQPYLVMDYVDGIPIDSYCASLDPRHVLTLFLEVCEAVSYAHRNLIIHRDLKPSNILIDTSGRPRLLDFGIARIVDATNDAQTVIRALTPEYASPEQVRGEARSTATDIYSLGAVLRKLLKPEDTPKDVRFILSRALRAEPDHRYATVEALANDIRAFLEHRPVQARSGNVWYFAQRFLRRYWLPCAAAGIAIVSLAAGLYIANRERAVAQRRFSQVRELANKFIALDQDVRDLPGVTKARNRIVSTALQYLAALGPEAGNDRDLSLEIANAYVQVAHAQGVPVNSNLGHLDQAEESLARANQFTDAALRQFPDRRAVLLSATIAHDRMIVSATEGQPEKALEYAAKAGQQLDRLMALGPDQNDLREAAYMYGNLAETFSDNRKFEDAIRYGRRAVDTSRSITRSSSANGNRALALGVIALALRQMGDLNAALDSVQEARRTQEQLAAGGLAWQRFNLALALQREASILGEDGEVNLNRPGEAVQTYRKALAICEELAYKDPNDSTLRSLIASISRPLANLTGRTDPASALAISDEALRRIRELKISNVFLKREEAHLLAVSSYAARSLGHAADARQRIDSALLILKETKDLPSRHLIAGSQAERALRASADDLAAQGKLEQAAEIYRELLESVTGSNEYLHDAIYSSRTGAALAGVLRRSQHTAEAGQIEANRVRLWEAWDRKLPRNPFVADQFAIARKN